MESTPENYPLPRSLKEQFAHPEHMQVRGEDVDIYDISPEEKKTEVVTILAPGFSATPMAHEQNIIGLAERGRRVISVDSPHGLAEHGLESNLVKDYPVIELDKLSAVIEAMDERDIDQVDVVAHSEGAMYMAIAASLYPDRFRNMVLVEPAGMIGQDNIFRLAQGMASDLKRQIENEAQRTDADRAKSGSFLTPIGVLASNIRRTAESIRAITETDIVEIVKDLQAKGINISIIHGVDDKLFPMDKMQKAIGKSAGVGFYSVRGGHGEIFIRPDQYTNAVSLALDALEAKSEKK